MMRKVSTHIVLILLSLHLAGQGLPPDFNPAAYLETLEIQTDRDYYAVNETIHFRAFNLSPSHMRKPGWSKVLYVEVISFDGKALLQTKIQYSGSGGEGRLLVPEGIPTGVYYIKAYTRWMRNYGPKGYYYRPITILNPWNTEINVPGPSHEADFELLSFLPENGNRISVDKEVYGTRSTARILFPDSTALPEDFAVGVTRKTFVRDSCLKVVPADPFPFFDFHFLPETRGICISGVLTAREGREVLPGRRVTVSLKKGGSRSFSASTDSAGVFRVVLPEVFGDVALMVLPEDKPGEEIDIRLESDFCTREVNLPYIPLKTSGQDLLRYREIIVNSQMRDLYRHGSQEAATVDLQDLYLYEAPSLRIEVDRYIAMASVRELFAELIPAVGFRKEAGRTRVFIKGPHYYMLDAYEPLVLLDGVIIHDMDALLRVEPGDLASIETFNFPYVLGDVTYGGIIKMKSAEGDMAGYQLPEHGVIYSYRTFDMPAPEETRVSCDSREPLLMNTLAWKCLAGEVGEPPNLQFRVGDDPGTYTVILQERGPNGQLLRSRVDFKVE